MNNDYVIQLVVNNHPGVMSHIVGLFSRRAYNLDGILCAKIGNGDTSQMYLLVKKDERTEQIVKQLKKLYDVLEISVHTEEECPVFMD